MIVKLHTEYNLAFLSLKGGCTGSLSLHLSKCHIVGNHVSWLIIKNLLTISRHIGTHLGCCNCEVKPEEKRHYWPSSHYAEYACG